MILFRVVYMVGLDVEIFYGVLDREVLLLLSALNQ